uniref:Uncharacterized protein n=1 Tax=Oryza glumipatula TaxID=40148 RepID=A0A0E0BS29_9ORYZ
MAREVDSRKRRSHSLIGIGKTDQSSSSLFSFDLAAACVKVGRMVALNLKTDLGDYYDSIFDVEGVKM